MSGQKHILTDIWDALVLFGLTVLRVVFIFVRLRFGFRHNPIFISVTNSGSFFSQSAETQEKR